LIIAYLIVTTSKSPGYAKPFILRFKALIHKARFAPDYLRQA